MLVVEEAGRRFFIGGEVRRPGAFALHPNETLVQALYEAGGLTPTAETRQVLLLRYQDGDGLFALRVDVGRILTGEGADVRLEPFDVIHAPPSGIALAGRFVDQYINALIPRVISFPFNTDLNTQRVKVIDNQASSAASVNR